MRFKLVIDKTQEETVVATVHERSRLTDEMELLVLQHDGSDRIAAGIGVVYQIERLPLLSATAIHAGALYLDYLLIYLLNNWIPRDWAFIGVFTLCFAVGYALIWGIILLSIRHRTNRINRHLRGGK